MGQTNELAVSIPVTNTPPNVDDVVSKVCNYLHVDQRMLESKVRKREVVYARQLCMYIIRNTTNHTLKFIGERFGGRDHTTAINAIKKINDRLYLDQLLGTETNAKKDLNNLMPNFMTKKIQSEKELLEFAQKSVHLLVNYRNVVRAWMNEPIRLTKEKMQAGEVEVDKFLSEILQEPTDRP